MKEILITSTVLILCVLLIRRVFRGKISSRLQYALWLLAALRLIIPVSAEFDLGSLSGFRLMDLVEEDESGLTGRLEEVIRLEEPVQISVNSGSILFRLFTTDEIRETLEGMPEDGPTAVFVAGRLGFSRLDVLWFFWGLGAFIVGVWILAANIVFSRRLRKTRKPFDLPEEVRAATDLWDGKDFAGRQKSRYLSGKKCRLPAFYLAEGISSPCLYGFPGYEAVYLTADVIGDTERLRHVVVHELVHKKHGDSVWALLRSVLVAVYWFHPLVWVAAVCSKRDCELACDEGALAMLGEGERISYGETLLSIITRKGRVSDLICTATTMTGSGRRAKERIQFIVKEPKVLCTAAAGALVLIAAACLFVFTRDARFHGMPVDAQAGLTVTGADMQIPLPASIGGISGCVAGEESDEVIIYHIAAQKEVGRFSRMSLKDALELVDEGREVMPVGDYGYNYLLRAYLGEPLSRTEHTYTPAGQGVLSHEDIYIPEEGIAGHEEIKEGGSETEEKADYLPDEHIIVTGQPDESSFRTEHTYTPAEETASEDQAMPDHLPGADEAAAGDVAAKGVPGTDTNDDTTYIIDDHTFSETDVQEEEGKSDYLPNEQIVTITFQPQEVNVDELYSGCYVYVRADFDGKVKDKYQKEMTFIDKELKGITGQVVILSLNRERREALFDAMTANRTPYAGDHVKVGALIDALPLPPTLSRVGGFSMQTMEEPYSLRFDYEMSTDYMTKEDQDMLYFNAAMLFYAIGNVDEIGMEIRNLSGADSDMKVYYRQELEKNISGLQNAGYEDAQTFREGLSDLHVAVETYLSMPSAE